MRQLIHDNWQFQAPDNQWLEAQIPGCIHTDLRRHDLIPDPFWGRNELDLQWIENRDWHYRATFSPDAELLNFGEIDLVCDGLDTVATVRLNGEPILQNDNMFHRHRISVKGVLRPDENVLEIRFSSAMDYVRTHRADFVVPQSNDPVGGCTRIRKQQCQFGWDWGPRFVSAGVWLPIYFEGWTGNRVESVAIEQHHTPGSVELSFAPQLARNEQAVFRATVSFAGEIVARGEGETLRLAIPDALLWWPAGQGAQPLYDVEVELLDGDKTVSRWQRRIGLRTIELDCEPDEFDVKSGEHSLNRFGFRVNGRLIFSKGANWIPAHSFVAGLGRKDYAPLLEAARDAHMNTIRVWGGGIYEHECFYDLCDELGLLVWQDFMFACTMYPADEAFVASVAREAREQATRLRHRACLALWCGNNEIVMMNHKLMAQRDDLRDGYVRLFLETIPAELRAVDAKTPYIHSSPNHQIPGVPDSHARSHDDHDWNVWHSRAPVEHYETTNHRFVSEFGMQSYPSPEVAASFCPPEELNILSPTFETHQKNSGGNATIFHYVAQQFRFPRDYAATSYLSQINQAICMKTAIEHFRRQQPQCLGALYWQLNDVWPVASWSSLEFGGAWKALHHFARRFFAPEMVSIKLQGEEKPGIGNYQKNTRGIAELWTVCDAPTSRVAKLRWQLATLGGEMVREDSTDVALEYGKSVLRSTVDFADALKEHGKENVFLHARLIDAQSGEELSRSIAHFTAPRFLNLSRAPIEIEENRVSESEIELTLRSSVYQYGVCLEAAGARFSDNFFDLVPGETRVVSVRDAEKSPHIFSLVDTF